MGSEREPGRPSSGDGIDGSDGSDGDVGWGVADPAGDGALVVRVHATPGARRDEVGGRHGDALRVKVRAPADRGRANEAVRVALAAALDVPRSAVALVSGPTSRAKRFRVEAPGGDRDRIVAVIRDLTAG